MSSLEHIFAPEEIMAFVDGELPAAEMRAVEAHLQECTECNSVAESFRATSAWMTRWDVEPVPADVESALAAGAPGRRERKGAARRPRRFGLRTWQLWTGGALTALALYTCFISIRVSSRPAHRMDAFISVPEPKLAQVEPTRGLSAPAPPPPPASSVMENSILHGDVTLDTLGNDKQTNIRPSGGGGGRPHQRATPIQGPLIARTASLVVAVKNLDASRAFLEQILARESGYIAHLTAGNEEDGPPTFQASLRIPAEEMPSALSALKALGRTVTESQSGEELTQEHADLVARLQNARETEDRYRAILAQHTGKVADILEVEEHISEVRGEIEQMEAEQKALDHRVDFATVDVQLTEEYKARLNAPDASVSTQIHNAFVAGYRHVADTLLGLVLFGEEYAPAIVLWLAILSLPGILVWRRYRRISARLS